jgi:hypothetical protein
MLHNLCKPGTLCWFAQIGIGPCRIDLTHFIRTSGRGKDNNWHVFQLRLLLQTLQQLKSTEPRQWEIEHDDIGTRGLGKLAIEAFSAQISQGFFAIRNDLEGRVEADLLKGVSGLLHLPGIGGNQ